VGKGRPRPLALAGALLLLAAGPLAEILSYDVRIRIGDGGLLRVRESIEVRALGREIVRGIYRDVPTRFPRPGGVGTVVAPFRVTAVRRNGRPEPHRLFSVDGPEGRSGVRIRIGREDVRLEHGVHRYVVEYETERWLRFGRERDTLTWNVTGSRWAFPIRSASAAVELPGSPPPSSVRLDAWTGPAGSTARDAEWAWSGDAGRARFRTTAPLDAGEGLTVRASFPSGVVAPPTEAQRTRWFRLDWGGFVDAGLVVLLVLGLYLLMWLRVGRDPESGAVVVRYEPPEGFSAAALGFLRERGFDPAHLTAAVVSLAVKGAVTIERDGEEWWIRPTDERPDDLTRDEKALLERLLGDGDAVSLSGSPVRAVRKAATKLEKRLEGALERSHFVNNRGWFAAGAVASAVGFAALAWRYRFGVPPESWFLMLWLAFWTLGVGTLVVRVVRSWRKALGSGPADWISAAFVTLFAVPFVGAEIVVGGMIYRRLPGHLLAAVIALAALNVAFYHLLERPTLKGRGVLDRLEGFRAYLGAAEEDRMERLQRPDRTLELFERYLPYAIALGVENEWAARFEDALASGGEAGGGSSTPAWYGTTADVGGPGALSGALGGSLASSLSASSASPSGGGSSGGGFSGGGGGGGGGGGW